MDPVRFDAVARRLARGTSRREVLKGIATGLLGVAAMPLTTLAANGGNSTCAQWCHAYFSGNDAGHCTSAAAQGGGPCYSCGPAAPAGSGALCGASCCSPGQVCDQGACCTPKTCTGLGADCGSVDDGCGGTLSCGSCAAPQTCGGGGTVNVCGSPANACDQCLSPDHGAATCVDGVCGIACEPGYKPCGTTCVFEHACCCTGGLLCNSNDQCVAPTPCAVCPRPEHGVATCINASDDMGACGVQCDAGYHLCGTTCIPDTSCCVTFGGTEHEMTCGQGEYCPDSAPGVAGSCSCAVQSCDPTNPVCPVGMTCRPGFGESCCCRPSGAACAAAGVDPTCCSGICSIAGSCL